MPTDGAFNQAFQSFSRRENLPAALNSEEWSSIPSEIRERAFFMSKVTDAEILQRFRDGVEEILRGEKGLVTVEKEIFFWLEERGYQPTEGKAGGLEDLSSLPRIMVVLRTNMEMARGHAQWVRAQTSIRAFPCRRFVRIAQRKEPRDWDARWQDAKAETADVPGVHATEKVALVNHPIWRKLSRFDQPYAPYDFGSGMGDELVSRGDSIALGFDLRPNTDPMQQPLFRSMNDGLEVTPQISDETLKLSLSDKLGRFADWDGEKLVFTDPDGTKKYPAAKLAEIWQRPAPEGYDNLTQKDALAAWKGGRAKETSIARVTLRRLFDRIETAETPAELWRSIRLTAADAVALIRGLAARKFRIPPDLAGWDWSATPSQSLRAAGSNEGWNVTFKVRGVKTAVDIGALRPGKPGFVYVGGTEFRITGFSQDVTSRTIAITMEEA